MTKPCRNVCGAQQLMKPAFSAPLMMFATEILMQCMGVGMIIIIVIVIVTMVRG
jgi:hypothetical protein